MKLSTPAQRYHYKKHRDRYLENKLEEEDFSHKERMSMMRFQTSLTEARNTIEQRKARFAEIKAAAAEKRTFR